MKIVRSTLYENIFLSRNRKKGDKINLDNVKLCYHWATQGKFFDDCYGHTIGDVATPYIIKKGKMPKLPITNYNIEGQISLTVDPTYLEPAFNENGPCIVFDFKKLKNDYKVLDLTDNSEAEIRISDIKNWPQYMIQLDILDFVYNIGEEWDEGIVFRPIKDWLPDELKGKVNTFKSFKELLRQREYGI